MVRGPSGQPALLVGELGPESVVVALEGKDEGDPGEVSVEVGPKLMRSDPFRELDRLSQQVFGNPGTIARPAAMPMDAWRNGGEFIVEFDPPGVNPDSVDLDVERNVLTVKAERPVLDGDDELVAAERPRGVFSRQLILGDNLDVEKVAATYQAGVLRLRIPVAERAKPRKIEINVAADGHTAIRA